MYTQCLGPPSRLTHCWSLLALDHPKGGPNPTGGIAMDPMVPKTCMWQVVKMGGFTLSEKYHLLNINKKCKKTHSIPFK